MYRVICDGKLIAQSAADDIAILAGAIEDQINAPAKLKITLYSRNPNRYYPALRRSVVEVCKNNAPIWRGQLISSSEDIGGNVTYVGVSELGYLSESIQAPFAFTGSANNLFLQLLTAHNEQTTDNKHILRGTISRTVLGPSMTVEQTNVDTTWGIVSELVARHGGIMRIRQGDDGNSYLDWLDSLDSYRSNTVEYGKNISDASVECETDDLYTCLRYTAQYKNGTEQVETVKTITNDDAIAAYGKIWAVETFRADSLATADAMAQARLAEISQAQRSVPVEAYDFSASPARVGDFVRVIIAPQRIDQWLIVAAVEHDLTGETPVTLSLGVIPPTLTGRRSVRIATNKYLRTLSGIVPESLYAVDANGVRAKSGGNYAKAGKVLI